MSLLDKLKIEGVGIPRLVRRVMKQGETLPSYWAHAWGRTAQEAYDQCSPLGGWKNSGGDTVPYNGGQILCLLVEDTSPVEPEVNEWGEVGL